MRRLSWNPSLSLRLTKRLLPSQEQLLKRRWNFSDSRLFLDNSLTIPTTCEGCSCTIITISSYNVHSSSTSFGFV